MPGKFRIEAERRISVLEVEQANGAAALKLQRTETDRRLTELNGEAGRIRAIQEQFTSEDRFDALDARVKILEGTQFRLAGQAENRTENKSQSNWTWQQVFTVGGIVVVAAIELHARGVI